MDSPLLTVGIDSLGAVELRNQLQRVVGDAARLPSMLIFDHPTARQLALLFRCDPTREEGIQLSLHKLSSSPVVYAAVAAGPTPSDGIAVQVTGASVQLPQRVSDLSGLQRVSHCGFDLLCEVPTLRWSMEQDPAGLRGTQDAEKLAGAFSPTVASCLRHGGSLCEAQLFAPDVTRWLGFEPIRPHDRYWAPKPKSPKWGPTHSTGMCGGHF